MSKLPLFALALLGTVIITNEFGKKSEPGPGTGEYFAILKRTGLGTKPESDVPLPEGMHPKRTAAPIVSKVNIGPFVVKMEKRKDNCSVKLFENIPGGRQTLRGSWTGDPLICDKKKTDVILAVRQVRAEERGVVIPESKKIKLPRLIEDVEMVRPLEPEERRLPVDLPRGPAEFDIVVGGVIQNLHPMSLASARERAKAMSTVVRTEVIIEPTLGSGRKSSGIVEESYRRGKKVEG